MQLNVYLISHPIINQLSNQIIHSTQKNNNAYISMHSQLNLFLIYEVLRKWIKIQNIYLKNIDYIKEMCIFAPKESYILFTNLEEHGNMILNIKHIIPRLEICHICLNPNTQKYININDKCIDHHILNIIKKQKIIIMEKLLDNYSILQLLDYLLVNQKININAIKIICISCTNNILEVIANKYPLLEIYTTKINN